MHVRCHLAAAWLVATSVLIPVPALADENLPDKRAACQSDARRQIKSRAGYGASLYGVTLNARGKSVRDCMARTRLDPAATGLVKMIPPLPVRPEREQAPVRKIRTR